MKRICDFIARWMGLIILATAILSMLAPQVLQPVSMSVINPLLGLIMFGMGLTLNPHDFRVVFTRPKDVIIGCLLQFIIMPSLAWLLSRLFALPPALALGVVLVGCCPGGTASNVITFLSKGDLALSIGCTAVSTILAPVVTPALTWLLAGTYADVNAVGMLLSILYIVITPIVLGFAVQKLFPAFTRRAIPYLPAFSTLMITAVVAMVVSHTSDALFKGGLLVLVVVILHNLIGLLLGFGAATLFGMSLAKRKALSIEVGMQNSGLASSLAVTHFAAYPLATIPGAVFSVWHNISGALVAKLYERWTDEKN